MTTNLILLLFSSLVFVVAQQKDHCNILSLSGGGSHAAIGLSILEEVQLPEYDLIAGLSGGSVNAMYLSYFNTNTTFKVGLSSLIDIWKGMKTTDVYTVSLMNINKLWAYYDNTPLRKSLEDIFTGFSYTNDTAAKPAVISLSNLNKAILDYKFLNSYTLKEQIDLVMASSAMPYLFPPVKINGTTYMDATILADEIIHGVYNFIDCKTYNITIISSDNKLEKIKTIDTAKLYVSRLLSIMLDDYNNQLVEIISAQCYRDDYSITLNYCYPLSKDINNFIKIRFENIPQLMAKSKNFTCEKYTFCL